MQERKQTVKVEVFVNSQEVPFQAVSDSKKLSQEEYQQRRDLTTQAELKRLTEDPALARLMEQQHRRRRRKRLPFISGLDYEATLIMTGIVGLVGLFTAALIYGPQYGLNAMLNLVSMEKQESLQKHAAEMLDVNQALGQLSALNRTFSVSTEQPVVQNIELTASPYADSTVHQQVPLVEESRSLINFSAVHDSCSGNVSVDDPLKGYYATLFPVGLRTDVDAGVAQLAMDNLGVTTVLAVLLMCTLHMVWNKCTHKSNLQDNISECFTQQSENDETHISSLPIYEEQQEILNEIQSQKVNEVADQSKQKKQLLEIQENVCNMITELRSTNVDSDIDYLSEKKHTSPEGVKDSVNSVGVPENSVDGSQISSSLQTLAMLIKEMQTKYLEQQFETESLRISISDSEDAYNQYRKLSQDTLSAKKLELDIAESQIRELRDKINKVHEQQANSESSVQGLNLIIEKQHDDMNKTQLQCEGLKEEMGVLELKIDELEITCQVKDDQIRSLESSLNSREMEISSLQGSLNLRETEISSLKSSLNFRETEISNLKSQLSSQDNVIKEQETLLTNLCAQIDGLKGQLDEASRLKVQFENEVEDLGQQLQLERSQFEKQYQSQEDSQQQQFVQQPAETRTTEENILQANLDRVMQENKEEHLAMQHFLQQYLASELQLIMEQEKSDSYVQEREFLEAQLQKVVEERDEVRNEIERFNCSSQILEQQMVNEMSTSSAEALQKKIGDFMSLMPERINEIQQLIKGSLPNSPESEEISAEQEAAITKLFEGYMDHIQNKEGLVPSGELSSHFKNINSDNNFTFQRWLNEKENTDANIVDANGFSSKSYEQLDRIVRDYCEMEQELIGHVYSKAEIMFYISKGEGLIEESVEKLDKYQKQRNNLDQIQAEEDENSEELQLNVMVQELVTYEEDMLKFVNAKEEKIRNSKQILQELHATYCRILQDDFGMIIPVDDFGFDQSLEDQFQQQMPTKGMSRPLSTILSHSSAEGLFDDNAAGDVASPRDSFMGYSVQRLENQFSSPPHSPNISNVRKLSSGSHVSQRQHTNDSPASINSAPQRQGLTNELLHRASSLNIVSHVASDLSSYSASGDENEDESPLQKTDQNVANSDSSNSPQETPNTQQNISGIPRPSFHGGNETSKQEQLGQFSRRSDEITLYGSGSKIGSNTPPTIDDIRDLTGASLRDEHQTPSVNDDQFITPDRKPQQAGGLFSPPPIRISEHHQSAQDVTNSNRNLFWSPAGLPHTPFSTPVVGASGLFQASPKSDEETDQYQTPYQME